MAESGSPWRLKAIIILFVFLTLFYGAYGVFGDITQLGDVDFDAEYNYNESSEIGTYDISSDDAYETDESGDDFISMIVNIGKFLTFYDFAEINTFIFLLFNTVTTICFIVIGYIIYTFIRDWIPFVG